MKQILVALLITALLLLVGCGSQKAYMCLDGSIAGGQQVSGKNVVYVCPDGREVSSTAQCRFELPLAITQEDAEKKAQSFVRGHVQANGWQTTLVDTYKAGENYQAQIIISKYNQDSYETIVEIDGQTGLATCAQNCEYIS